MITLEKHGHIAQVRLARPEKRNALNLEGWQGLSRVMGEIDADRELRVVVLGGEGPGFCAGIDLVDMMSHLPVDPGGGPPDGAKSAAFHEFIRELQRAVSAIERCRVPVIAAVHGHCLGGGLDLATAADIRLAAADARFSVRETRMAMVADVGAEEAQRLGLVNRVLEDRDALMRAADELAAEIAGNAPLAVQGTKRVMNEATRLETDRGLEYVATWNAAHLLTQDLGMAVTAFMTREKPEFSGR